MQTLYMVPEREMKRFDELTQTGAGGRSGKSAEPPSLMDVLSKRESAEAFTALTLDKLAAEILARPDLSEWTKAQMLSDNLQKFLSHKAQAFPEDSALPPLPPMAPSATIFVPFSSELSQTNKNDKMPEIQVKPKSASFRKVVSKSGLSVHAGRIAKSRQPGDLSETGFPVISPRRLRNKGIVNYKRLVQGGAGEMVISSLPRWIVI